MVNAVFIGTMLFSMHASIFAQAETKMTTEDFIEAPHSKVEIRVAKDETNNHAAVVWQGMDHLWERTVLGIFNVPHRISKFYSYISGVNHELDSKTGQLSTTGAATMGMSTGVDGNYMNPKMFYSSLYSPDVQVYNAHVTVEATDKIILRKDKKDDRQLTGGFRYLGYIKIPNVSNASGDVVTGLFNGIKLKTDCPTGMTCNSNGFWPYRMLFGIDSCRLDSAINEIECQYSVEIKRGWTPNLGGVPPFEIKPLNPSIHYTLEVDYVVLQGKEGLFAATRDDNEAAFSSAHGQDETTQHGKIIGEHSGSSTFTKAAVGINRWGFQLNPPRNGEKFDHRGRYIGGITMRVGAALDQDVANYYHDQNAKAYDRTLGRYVFELEGYVELPRTVKKTGIQEITDLTLLQFSSPEAVVSNQATSTGQICVDSSIQAPRLTKWKKCRKILAEGTPWDDDRGRSQVTVPFGFQAKK